MKVLPLLLTLCACAAAQNLQEARSRLQGIDVDKVLNNDRVLKSYINCFLDQGPCTPEGRDAKKIMPQLYFENCDKCKPDEKKLLKKATKAFMAKRKDDWTKLVNKYDPEHKHEQEFLKWLEEE